MELDTGLVHSKNVLMSKLDKIMLKMTTSQTRRRLLGVCSLMIVAGCLGDNGEDDLNDQNNRDNSSRNDDEQIGMLEFEVYYIEEVPEEAELITHDDHRIEGVEFFEEIIEYVENDRVDGTSYRQYGEFEGFVVGGQSNTDRAIEANDAYDELPIAYPEDAIQGVYMDVNNTLVVIERKEIYEEEESE